MTSECDRHDAAAAFDEADFLQRLRALNPWAEGLTPPRADFSSSTAGRHSSGSDFSEARQHACLDRAKQGYEAWNEWADATRALASELDAARSVQQCLNDTRSAERSDLNLDQIAINDTEAEFLALAVSDFRCAKIAPFVSFSWMRFPGFVDFHGATFCGDAIFKNTKFYSDSDFGGAIFARDAHFYSSYFELESDFRSCSSKGQV